MISERSKYNPNFPATMTPAQIDKYREEAGLQSAKIRAALKASRISRKHTECRKKLNDIKEKRRKFDDKVSSYFLSL